MSLHVFAESTLPSGCRAVAVRGESIPLKSKKSKLVFIHNLTNTDLWMTHPVTHTGVHAGWTSRLQADHWSALVVNKPSFILNCIESRPGHEQQVSCEGTIAVCKWKRVKVPANGQSSTFWVAEDMSVSGLKAAVGARGFVIPERK